MSEARSMNLNETSQALSGRGLLVQKWAPFLKGMPTQTESQRYFVGCAAQLMENQTLHLKRMTEETRTTNVGSFTKYIFPLLKQTFPNLIAPNIVSMQPINSPISAVFYYDLQYSTNKGSVVAGQTFPRDFNAHYSSEYIDGELLATGNGTDFGGAGAALAATVVFKPVQPLNANRRFSVVIRQINNTTGAVVQQATDNGAGGFTGDTSAGAINYTTGAITAFKFTTAVTTAHLIKAFYFYDSEYSSNLGKVSLNVTSAPVTAVSRKLTANWSAEAAEDLMAFHGEDVEAGLVSGMAKEIAMEIDRDIIQQLFAASTGTTGRFDRIPPPGISEIDHLRSLITQISMVSNVIHKKTLRSPANFIVTSPLVSALVSQLTTHSDFKPLWSNDMSSTSATEAPTQLSTPGEFGIYRTGTLSNKWMIYEDPWFDDNQMLVGLNGRDYLNAGFVWAPYVMLQATQSFQDPNDFTIRKGLRTRYATKMLRSEFYGRVTIDNL